MTETVDTGRMKTWKVVALSVCGTLLALIVLSCVGSPFWQGFVTGLFR